MEWDLRPDGEPWAGSSATLTPVRTTDGRRAVLRAAHADAEPTSAHLALRAWAGTAAVELWRADPHRGLLLTERAVPGDDLSEHDVVTACEVVAGLYPQLHRRTLPQLDRLADRVPGWTDDLATLGRTGSLPRRFVEQAVAWATELTADATSEVLLHGNLHFAHVLAARREPWLVVAPRPVSGEPAYEVAPLLLTRWAEAVATGGLRNALLERLFTVVDTAGLDEDRTRAWVCVRAMTELAAAVRRGAAGPDAVTRTLTVVKAVQR